MSTVSESPDQKKFSVIPSTRKTVSLSIQKAIYAIVKKSIYIILLCFLKFQMKMVQVRKYAATTPCTK